jgi:mono/diheme cytochrome c family protein
MELKTTESQVSANNIDNRSTDELLQTISSLEGQLEGEVSAVRNFAAIGVAVFTAGLVGLLIFDSSSLPLTHKLRPALSLAQAAQTKYDKQLNINERNMGKSLDAALNKALETGRVTLAESSFGAIAKDGVDTEDKKQKGQVLVSKIIENTPAAKLGLKLDDQIDTVNGHKVKNLRDYQRALSDMVNKQGMSIAMVGSEAKQAVFNTNIAFSDYKHGVEHFAHVLEALYEKHWTENKAALLTIELARFELEHKVDLAGNIPVAEKDNQKLTAAKQELEAFVKDQGKVLAAQVKNLQSKVDLASAHLKHEIESVEALKSLVFDAPDSFLAVYTKALNGFWEFKIGGQVQIAFGKKRGYSSEQQWHTAAYKVYRNHMEGKLIEYFGTPSNPKMKGFNDLEEDADPEEFGEQTSTGLLKQGQHFYFRHCQHCHGVSGFGDGPTAPFLNPLPRNYTRGMFKLKSNSSVKASIKDLERTIKHGMPGSMMPPFNLYSAGDIRAVAHYVRYLAMRGEIEYLVHLEVIAKGEIKGIIEDPEAEDDPLLAVDEKFNDFYGMIKEQWHQVKKLSIPVEGEPVAAAPVTPRRPDAAMLGTLHAELLKSFEELSAKHSWDRLAAQVKTLQAQLEKVKSKNEAALKPLTKARDAWLAQLIKVDTLRQKIAIAKKKGKKDDVAKLSKALSDAKFAIDNKDGLKAATLKAMNALDKSLHPDANAAEGETLEEVQVNLKAWTQELGALEINLDSWIKHSQWMASLDRGEKSFAVNCARCHGFDGRGGGAEGVDFDNWGQLIKPRNLTRGIYRGGGRPLDIYWRFRGGIGGTPMPAFKDFTPEENWAIVNFVKNLATKDGQK